MLFFIFCVTGGPYLYIFINLCGIRHTLLILFYQTFFMLIFHFPMMCFFVCFCQYLLCYKIFATEHFLYFFSNIFPHIFAIFDYSYIFTRLSMYFFIYFALFIIIFKPIFLKGIVLKDNF